jgi:hypothetical protein
MKNPIQTSTSATSSDLYKRQVLFEKNPILSSSLAAISPTPTQRFVSNSGSIFLDKRPDIKRNTKLKSVRTNRIYRLLRYVTPITCSNSPVRL